MAKKGMSLVSALVALFLLLVGISLLARVIPDIERLSQRARNFTDSQMIADRIFDEIQEKYGAEGTAVPASLSGDVNRRPGVTYKVEFTNVKENFYEVRVTVAGTREGKRVAQEFVSVLHQR
jgi:Tfp pilus assembly protein PilV